MAPDVAAERPPLAARPDSPPLSHAVPRVLSFAAFRVPAGWPSARRARFVALLACASLVAAGWACALPSGTPGAWVEVEAPQLSVPLVAGTTVVEVRHREKGWTERVVVESDGRTVTRGINVEEIDPGVEAPLDADRVAYFRSQVGSDIASEGPALARGAALCDWVTRRTYRKGADADAGDDEDDDDDDNDDGNDDGDARRGETAPARRPVAAAVGATARNASGARRGKLLESRDGRAVLESIDGGAKYNCASLAAILYDAARALDLPARRVDLAVRHLAPSDGHSIVELWSEDDARWVALDPTFNCRYQIGGRPAGAIDLFDAVTSGREDRVDVVRPANAAGRDPYAYAINPLAYYRNVYLILPSGHWIMRANPRAPIPIAGAPNYLLADSDEPFRARENPLSALEVRRASSRGRIAYQASRGSLCVWVANFEPGAYEARTTANLQMLFSGASEAFDKDDASLFAPVDLVASPAVRLAPDGTLGPEWVVKGDAELSAHADGVLVDGGPDGAELALRSPVSGPVPAAGFARLRVLEGRAYFGTRARRGAGDYMRVDAGGERTVSTRIVAPRRDRFVARLKLDPGTRCVIEEATIRRALRLGDVR